MSTIEQRLRDAYQEAAATVPPASLRGVPAAGRRPVMPRQRPEPRGRRLLAPVAAAVAVTAIAVTAVAVPQLLPGQGGRATTASPGPPARYFIASGKSGGLAVYSAATGRRTGTVLPAKPHTALNLAAATGNDRIFIVTSTSTGSCGSTELLRLTLSATGKPASIGSMPVPKVSGSVTALASSADGQTIAYAAGTCAPGAEAPGFIGMVHTNGDPSRRWGWGPNPGQSVGSLSITADGKLIQYAATPNKITGPNEGQSLAVRVIRVLPVSAAPGTAAQRSRAVVRISTSAPGADFTSSLIAASGQTVYFCTERGQFSRHPAETLRAYDVASGTTSVLHSFGTTRGQGCLLGASAGDLLILRDITTAPSHVDRLNLRTGRLTAVPVRRAVDEGNSSVPW